MSAQARVIRWLLALAGAVTGDPGDVVASLEQGDGFGEHQVLDAADVRRRVVARQQEAHRPAF
jgi:hypothetical protein